MIDDAAAACSAISSIHFILIEKMKLQ